MFYNRIDVPSLRNINDEQSAGLEHAHIFLEQPAGIVITSYSIHYTKLYEKDDMNLHGVSPFDKITGKSPKKTDAARSYTSLFADALVEIVKMLV